MSERKKDPKEVRWSDGGEACNNCMSNPAQVRGLCDVCRQEKPLYQIAVERIIDRIGRANAGVKNELIFLVREAAEGRLADPNVKSGAVDWLVRNLFPELKRD